MLKADQRITSNSGMSSTRKTSTKPSSAQGFLKGIGVESGVIQNIRASVFVGVGSDIPGTMATNGQHLTMPADNKMHVFKPTQLEFSHPFHRLIESHEHSLLTPLTALKLSYRFINLQHICDKPARVESLLQFGFPVQMLVKKMYQMIASLKWNQSNMSFNQNTRQHDYAGCVVRTYTDHLNRPISQIFGHEYVALRMVFKNFSQDECSQQTCYLQTQAEVERAESVVAKIGVGLHGSTYENYLNRITTNLPIRIAPAKPSKRSMTSAKSKKDSGLKLENGVSSTASVPEPSVNSAKAPITGSHSKASTKSRVKKGSTYAEFAQNYQESVGTALVAAEQCLERLKNQQGTQPLDAFTYDLKSNPFTLSQLHHFVSTNKPGFNLDFNKTTQIEFNALIMTLVGFLYLDESQPLAALNEALNNIEHQFLYYEQEYDEKNLAQKERFQILKSELLTDYCELINSIYKFIQPILKFAEVFLSKYNDLVEYYLEVFKYLVDKTETKPHNDLGATEYDLFFYIHKMSELKGFQHHNNNAKGKGKNANIKNVFKPVNFLNSFFGKLDQFLPETDLNFRGTKNTLINIGVKTSLLETLAYQTTANNSKYDKLISMQTARYFEGSRSSIYYYIEQIFKFQFVHYPDRRPILKQLEPEMLEKIREFENSRRQSKLYDLSRFKVLTPESMYALERQKIESYKTTVLNDFLPPVGFILANYRYFIDNFNPGENSDLTDKKKQAIAKFKEIYNEYKLLESGKKSYINVINNLMKNLYSLDELLKSMINESKADRAS